MILLFFLIFTNLSFSLCSSSHLQCPPSFQCKNLQPFKYPFYNNSTDPRCGFFKLNCNKDFAEIDLINNRILQIESISDNQLLVYNKTFQPHQRIQNCEAYNKLGPIPTYQSIPVNQSCVPVFNCTNRAGLRTDYKFNCNNESVHLYYNISTQVHVDTPVNCTVFCLHDNQTNIKLDDLISILSSDYTVLVNVSDCVQCLARHGQCQVIDQKFQCIPKERNKHVKAIIISVTVGSAFVFVVAIAVFMIRRARKRKSLAYFSSKDESGGAEDVSVYFGASVFAYSELEEATHRFESTRELGDGGFGTVYYGKLRDGREVAVKRLYEHNYKRVQQFMNEVEILTRLRHKNLVSLYGCTSRKSRELLLVYEYISNGTVADHLHGDRAKPRPLTWQIRMKIAVETAKALVYLHASEIIHRDVKTNNILLDHNYCVKVADFGLSRLLPSDVTHVSTAPQGTPGYVDPEYHQKYQLTDKSDVYSFGVVLIELISSMPAIDISRSRDEISLATMAINRIQRCALDELIDPILGSDPDTQRMTTLVAELAFRCLQFDSETRPTMSEVLEVLERIQLELVTEDVDNIGELAVTPSMPPPSPENEDVGLLKGRITASPVSVTAKWNSTSSGATTPVTSVVE